jgi:hypothetical protein
MLRVGSLALAVFGKTRKVQVARAVAGRRSFVLKLIVEAVLISSRGLPVFTGLTCLRGTDAPVFFPTLRLRSA